MKTMIIDSRDDLEGNLYALGALSACKIFSEDTRVTILDAISSKLSRTRNEPARIEALVAGIYGIAM